MTQGDKQQKIKVGIFFGGASREREVSFAGGRTVYDNLDKGLFEAIPIFVDERGNFLELDWHFVYRGTIRDFYPPVSFLPSSPNHFQIYGESIRQNDEEQLKMLSELGRVILVQNLKNEIDIAFLALHGFMGEDGSIQGLLEWYGIPYTGSGIVGSAFGVNKALQKSWLSKSGFNSPPFFTFNRDNWDKDRQSIYQAALDEVGFPLAVKAANQGSSIGISLLEDGNFDSFSAAVDHAFFRLQVSRETWHQVDKVKYVQDLTDIRSSLGFPLWIEDQLVYHPEDALCILDELFVHKQTISLQAQYPEVEIVVESMLSGKEFSCIVVDDDHGNIIALPPTEIVKKKALFDYKSKYLPGLSRKVTPIGLPDDEIERIRTECENLFRHFAFNVYARIDGFYTSKGEIFLNDPNTTSGMMPSSFFFHQAAEIGLNPSQFLSYLIHCSLSQRLKTTPGMAGNQGKLERLNNALSLSLKSTQQKKKVAVLLGGYSTERHISVESGRNIFEKLSSSINYDPFPVFVTGSDKKHELYIIPINMMLKDNADDIKHKVENFERPALLDAIVDESKHITNQFVGEEKVTFEPRSITYSELAKECDAVFIALHGRPGEDGAVQAELEKVGLPYNGSGQESSGMTINKYDTNNLLRDNGFLVAGNHLVVKEHWLLNKDEEIRAVEKLGYPFIAKPSDEGCSSAVIKIRTREQLLAYADICFRNDLQISPEKRSALNLDVNDEFPFKGNFLVETFIDRKGADHFLEVTGGLLTRYSNSGEIEYEVFEPSEALAEGEVLSLAEKFLAGEGQNITPARFDPDEKVRQMLSDQVKIVLGNVAKLLHIEGYCRIDAFVRIYERKRAEVIIIEINSLPGMTPATCIYHQASINGYKPFDFIDKILNFGEKRQQRNQREKIA